MKIKTTKENVLKYGQKTGVTLEVSEETGKHLISRGVAEQVKQKKAPQAPKEKDPKSNTPATKEGE